jgi:hypothetical protein
MSASVFNPLFAGKPHWHTRKCEAFLTYLSAKNLRRAGWLAMRTRPPLLGAGGRCRPPETGFEDVVLRPLISCGAVTAPLFAAGQPSQPMHGPAGFKVVGRLRFDLCFRIAREIAVCRPVGYLGLCA